MNLLFICYSGLNRSPTAAQLYNGDYVGIYEIDGRTINKKLSEKLQWADHIFVFEDFMVDIVRERISDKPIIFVDIPDLYFTHDPKLIKLLDERVKPLIPIDL